MARTSSTQQATPATAAILSRTASLSARARRSSLRCTSRKLRNVPECRRRSASFNITQLGDHAGQDRQRHQLPRPDDFQQRSLLHQGKRRQRRQHRLLRRSHAHVCNDNNGVGLPPAGASLPTAPLAYNPALLQTKGLDPNNMCILKGFPTPAEVEDVIPLRHLVCDANTLYVADEGNGDNTSPRLLHHGCAAKPRPDFRSGSSIRPQASGSWLICCSRVASRRAVHRRWLSHGNNSGDGTCRGRRQPTACATSPAS